MSNDARSMGLKGGRARAEKLTPERRAEIARTAASARWSKQRDDGSLPRALCGGNEPLRIGQAEIPCYVLEEGAVDRDDDRRLITASGLQQAVGMSASGGSPRLADFAARIASNSHSRGHLSARLNEPVEFIMPQGGVAKGYGVLLLADLCDEILEARKTGRLTDRYAPIGDAAEAVMRGLANVALVALVDEATGYQDVRRRLELAEILDQYLDDKLNRWTKTFPDEFYEQLFRLKGWDYKHLKPGDIKPAEVGMFTKEHVYRRLHPGIVEELESRNPEIVPGRRRNRHHQWLSQEIGHVELEKHITKIIVVMKLSRDWQGFMSSLQEIVPLVNSDTAYFDFVKDS